jgi:plasmid stability protein
MEARMTTLTVKGVPEELYERLKQSATESHRSINSEVIVCLERSLLSRRVDPEAFLARVDFLQKKVTLPPLTDELLRKAKAEGRP